MVYSCNHNWDKNSQFEQQGEIYSVPIGNIPALFNFMEKLKSEQ